MAEIALTADTVELEILPPLTREMAEVAGLKAALEVTERWGGTRLFFPKQVDGEHPLTLTVGLEAARKLCDRFGGDEPSIPRAANALKYLRNQIIARRYLTESAAAIARDYGMTERWVYEIVSREQDDRQISLF